MLGIAAIITATKDLNFRCSKMVMQQAAMKPSPSSHHEGNAILAKADQLWPCNEVAMDIDSPAVSTVSVEKAIEQLSAFVQTKDDETNKRNIYATQESMETISLATSILNLKIQAVDESPNLIYTQQIYDNEKLRDPIVEENGDLFLEVANFLQGQSKILHIISSQADQVK
ncbi:hypothetical protein HDU77_005043 [Chytriomyces hyalinus]|nr:hypothetical protein HDU77_005043 [Chytriomyces hyalinus]